MTFCLSYFGARKLWAAALELLPRAPRLHELNAAMKATGKALRWREALRLFGRVEELKLLPDLYSRLTWDS